MYSPAAESHRPHARRGCRLVHVRLLHQHNIGIAFQCFAGGLFAGVGSMFFLGYNGAFGGAVAGYLTERGLSPTFYSFVVTHAAFELTAIVLLGRRRAAHRALRCSRPGASRSVQALDAGGARVRRDHLRRHRHAAHRRGHRGVLVLGTLAAVAAEVRRRGVCWVAVLGYLTFQGRRAD